MPWSKDGTGFPNRRYVNGLHSTAAYQVSGVPYISGNSALAAGEQQQFEFPYVSRNITVVNHSSVGIRVHFNASGSGRIVNGFHYVDLDSDEDSYTFNVKAAEIYVSNPNSSTANFRVIAELTTIPSNDMFLLTGSGLTD